MMFQAEHLEGSSSDINPDEITEISSGLANFTAVTHEGKPRAIRTPDLSASVGVLRSVARVYTSRPPWTLPLHGTAMQVSGHFIIN